MQEKSILISLIAAAVIASGFTAGCTQEKSDDYYAGKTVFVYVGRTPGSGADIAVRSFVRFWQQHIPGEPTMVVKNVPGGGGSRVWNLGWENDKEDALEIFFSPVSGIAVIVEQEGMRADLSQMPMVGALTSPNMTFARTDRLKAAEDLPSVKGLQFGGQAPAHRFNVLGRLTLDILGVEYTSVDGFRGSSDVFNAMRRKEVDIQTAPLNFYRFTVEPGVVKSGEVIPLWYNPVIDKNGEVRPLEAAGDIPSFFDFYESVKGKSPEGELFEMYKWLLPNVNGIVYAALMPPQTSDEPLQILRESFISATQDENYRTEELKMFGFHLPVVDSEQGAEIFSNMANAPESVRSFLRQYIQESR
ncbi:MAG: hypothetical protein KAJ57_11305 [Woeseiaceae bacterium]|nr:hypothetical protein [Woeseiaceae bacterium]